MEKIHAFLKVSFGTKVLVPVVITMVLLMSATVWLVNQRVTHEFQSGAARTLASADASLKQLQTHKLHDLLLRYHNLPKEPRYKAAFQTADPATMEDLLKDLRSEQGLDVVLYTTNRLSPLCSCKHDPLLSVPAFLKASGHAVEQALAGQEQVDVVRVDDRLFYVISIPSFGTGDHLTGALTIGSEIGSGTAGEWSEITRCQIVLLAENHVIASTLRNPEANEQYLQLFNQLGAASEKAAAPTSALLNGEHYYCSAGQFTSLDGTTGFGWLLFSSYEQPLQALQSTQGTLLAVSAVGILGGILVVWLLIRRITRPLRELHDSAEAVGKGDFSCRVEVKSGDECGELAFVFNQMTENLQRSREQLERTVETLKTTQAHLIQSEKLSGIGEFVAGVAHELNNPLTSVMGFSELLARADANPQHKRHLDMIHKSALRCQKIVQSLLSFARRHQPERKLSSVNELVQNAIEFLAYQLRTSNIEVVTQLDPHLPNAMVDPHQVQQVFLNIINNARQAMEAHQPSGSIRIRTETCGDHVRIVFQDTGPGISEQNLSKVFDPFFTTKEVGKGTGLGLSLCYGIIQEHGGTIQVSSKPGEGATFAIELPLAGEVSTKPTALPTPSIQTEHLTIGSGKKILVIDDEEGILEILKETLTDSGYQVDTAPDGESALSCVSRGSYDLALCDWKMPGLNGQQVYERLRSSDPELSERMIFITGDVINEKTRNFLKERNKVCLSKPFSLKEFRSAVRDALEER